MLMLSHSVCLGPYLDAFFGDGVVVEAEDGVFNDVDGRQHSHPDVNGITPFWIQNDNLCFFQLRSFLRNRTRLYH